MIWSESLISICIGALSTITAFILGYRKQSNAAYHQFVLDNEKFRREVLALVEIEKNNNAGLSSRVEMLEKQIEELKQLNHQQSLNSIKDAAENSRLSLVVEKYKLELLKNENNSDAQVKKIQELEEKCKMMEQQIKELEVKLQECLDNH